MPTKPSVSGLDARTGGTGAAPRPGRRSAGDLRVPAPFPEPALPTVLQAVARRRAFAAGVVLVCLLLGLLALVAAPPRPTAQALVVVQDPAGTTEDGSVAARYAQDQAEIMDSALVAGPAAELLGGRLTAEQVLADTAVTVSKNGNALAVSFTAGTPDLAGAGAEAVVTAYQDLLRSRVQLRTADEVRQIEAQMAELDAVIAAARTPAEATPARTDRARLADQRASALLAAAGTPGITASALGPEPVTPWLGAVLRNLAIAGTLGAALAGAACYLLALRRLELRTPASARRMLAVPVLAQVPVARRRRAGVLQLPTPGEVPPATAALAAGLLASGGRVDVVALVGCRGADGALDVAAGLAVLASAGASSTVLVEVVPERGLHVHRVQPPDGSGLPPDGPAARLERKPDHLLRLGPWDDASSALDRLRAGADLVVVAVPDADDLGSWSLVLRGVDAVVLVVGARTPVADLELLVEQVGVSDVDVVGCAWTVPRSRRVLRRQARTPGWRRGRAVRPAAGSHPAPVAASRG